MKTKERMPNWLAVALSVVVSLPFGLWLGDYSLPLWIAFIVWAEYFMFGSSLGGLRTLIPAFMFGVVMAGAVQSFAILLTNLFGGAHLVAAGDLATAVAYFIGFGVAVFLMDYIKVLRDGTLAYFQGIAITLGAIFTGQGVAYVGHSGHAYALLVGSVIVTALACLLGSFIGWLNVTLNGAVESPAETDADHSGPSPARTVTASETTHIERITTSGATQLAETTHTHKV
jgi:hypothetical protein